MLANFFGKTDPINFIIIFTLFLCYATAQFFLGLSAFNSPLWLGSVLVLYVLLFFFFNFVLGKNKLTLYNSYGFLFFVLLFGIFPFVIFDRYELMVNLILLIMLRRVYSLRTPKSIYKKMFDSGFWLAILFILDPFSVVFGLLIFSSILLFQKFNLKATFSPIIGFIAPMICYFTYCYWMDDIDSFAQLFVWYTDYDFSFYTTAKVRIPMIIVGAIALLSILFKTPKVLLVSGNYRKFWTLVILNLLVSIVFILITKNRNGAELMCAFFPTAVILTNGIEGFSKELYRDLVLGFFVLTPIVIFIV
jgi:hypothetical protein